MAWYSYFLLSLPETLAALALTFVLLGISIRTNQKPYLLLSVLYSAIAFFADQYMSFSFKVYLLFVVLALLTSLFLKLKIIQGFLVSLIFYISIFTFQTVFILLYTLLFSLDFHTVLASPWKRILLANATNLPMALAAYVLYKKNITIPFLSSRLQ
ncbi:hypothetical protein [Robertmurraya korlensis]|uniref:hypothetical protein n=1 Tax=Robertmurraya korlensis TaxID=519977 RepID=UPI000825B782|nr:hypothetical protein [Robertmurraya korlensis]